MRSRRNLAGHPAALVVLVARAVEPDLLALVAVGEEVLRVAAGVLRDDRVRGVEDRLGRAEVLFEQDDRGVGKALLELQDVAHVGRAEAVDRLVRVARRRRGCGARPRASSRARSARRWCPGTRRPAGSGSAAGTSAAPRHRRASSPRRSTSRSSKSMAFASAQPLRVELVDLGDAPALRVVAVRVEVGARARASRSWPPRSPRTTLRGLRSLRIEVELLHDALDRRLGVAGVVDREARAGSRARRRARAACAGRPSGTSRPTSGRRRRRRGRPRGGASRRPPCW